MPYYKIAYNKQKGVYYPRAVVQGKPVETDVIAKDLSRISTVSNSDVQAVLGDIAPVMYARMAMGKSVHIAGLGYFRLVLTSTGVSKIEDFDFKKQVQAVRVEFIPERKKITSGTFSRTLVDFEPLEWIRVTPEEEEIVSEIKEVIDVKTGKTDGTWSRGGIAKILGTGLYLVGEDGVSNGVVNFYNETDPDTPADTVTSFAVNEDEMLVFLIPNDLAEGKYRVTLETYYSGTGDPLEEVKIIECPEITLI